MLKIFALSYTKKQFKAIAWVNLELDQLGQEVIFNGLRFGDVANIHQ